MNCLEWVDYLHGETSSDLTSGWYRVAISGDSETDGPHVFYEFPDYETWGFWTKAEDAEFENFTNGFHGFWNFSHDEEPESIFSICGPVIIPERKSNEQ